MFGGGPDISDPIAWAVPLGRFRGMRVYVHFTFLLLAAFQLIWAAFPQRGEPLAALGLTSTALLALLLVALAHELGHALAAYLASASAGSIVLWPLGGLTDTRAALAPRTALWAVAGGWLANALLAAALIPIVWRLGGGGWREVLLFNPLEPGSAFTAWSRHAGSDLGWAGTLLWWTHYANLLLLAANAIPMHPFDAAAALESALVSPLGRRRAGQVVSAIGWVIALLGATVAAYLGDVVVFSAAAFGWLCCVHAARRQAFLDEVANTPFIPGRAARRAVRVPLDDEPIDLAPATFRGRDQTKPADRDVLQDTRLLEALERVDPTPHSSPSGPKPAGPRRRTPPIEVPREDDESRLDRILAKISARGIGSLTESERHALESATARRRRE